MVLVETPKHKMLLDVGMYQSNDRYADFLINNRRYKEFKAKDVDLVFISHFHSDHSQMLPRLYKQGFRGIAVVSEKSKPFLYDMLLDSANINERDVLIINAQHKKSYSPLYDVEDVENCMLHISEFPINKKVKVDDELSFELIPNGHIIGSTQIMLYITIDGLTKTLLYTGDIGNKVVDNKFVGKYQQVKYADVVIAESTYGDRHELKVGNKERKTDLQKMKSVIDEQVKEKCGRIIIPVFALSRCQSIAYMLYELYKDSEWTPKVCVDSPLAIKLFGDYTNALEGEEQKLFKQMIDSGFLHFIKESIDSKALVDSEEPCVILSTAGMCQTGRIRHHLKRCVPDKNATLLFVGYASSDSLAGILRDPKHKVISIDHKDYSVRCNVVLLRSMSGHAPFNQLVENYTSINCQKLILHHGSKQAKEILAHALQEEYEKQCKSTRVVISNSGLKFTL